MQTASVTIPMPETPSVTSIWVRNNVIWAVIGVVIGVVLFGTDKLFGVGTPGTSTALRAMGAGVNMLAMIASVAAYAILTGMALAQKLPAFPQRMWTMLHVAMGAVIGVGAGVIVFYADPSATPVQLPEIGRVAIAVALMMVIGISALAGAIFGGIQALVLRNVATQLMPWIVLTALATAAMVAMFFVAMAVGLVTLGDSFGNLMALQAVIFTATVMAALIMLPAVNRLTPRVPGV